LQLQACNVLLAVLGALGLGLAATQFKVNILKLITLMGTTFDLTNSSPSLALTIIVKLICDLPFRWSMLLRAQVLSRMPF
jgi:hypothetical protein